MLKSIVIAEKTKVIIMAILGGALAISLLLNISVYGAKKALEQELQYSKAENLMLTKKLEDLRKENKRFQEQITALISDLKKVSEEKEASQKEIGALNKERDKTLKEKDELAERLKAQAIATDENAALKQQLASLNSGKAELEKKLGELSEEKGKLELKIKEMEAAKEGSIELPAIVVSPRQGKAAAGNEGEGPAKPGSILSVNKENNFVIIDLGQEQGVKAGDTFSVYRRNQQVAIIEVIQTRSSISACDIKKEIQPVEAGDSIK